MRRIQKYRLWTMDETRLMTQLMHWKSVIKLSSLWVSLKHSFSEYCIVESASKIMPYNSRPCAIWPAWILSFGYLIDETCYFMVQCFKHSWISLHSYQMNPISSYKRWKSLLRSLYPFGSFEAPLCLMWKLTLNIF